MPVVPTDAPIDRVVANLESAAKKSPNDADAYYRLGRAHSLAYVTKLDTIRGFGPVERFEPLPPDCRDWQRDKKEGGGKALSQEQVDKHLGEAVKNLGKAIRLRREPRYYLALAAVLETAGDSRVSLDIAEVLPDGRRADKASDSYVDALPEVRAESVVRARVLSGSQDPALKRWDRDDNTLVALWNARNDKDPKRREVVGKILADFWFAQTTDAYFTAFSLSLATEAKQDDRPAGTLGLRISVESGQGFLRVIGSRPHEKSDDARPAIVEVAVRELSKQQMNGGITPVLFSLRPGRSLGELIDARQRVSFDLDGSGLPQAWSWVTPEAGLLVWDPRGTGRISSGRQLFGSASWWIIFDDGYQALDALDDNRDGRVERDELLGVRAWFDRNSDGVSDAGEVVDLATIGVVSISCRKTGVVDGCPFSSNGIEMSDGRVLATYDWIATPANSDGVWPFGPANPRSPAVATVVKTLSTRTDTRESSR